MKLSHSFKVIGNLSMSWLRTSVIVVGALEALAWIAGDMVRAGASIPLGCSS